MATSALPRGKTIILLGKSESTYGMPPSGNWTQTFMYSMQDGLKMPMQDDPLLGVARTNNRDATEPAPGLISNDCSFVVPVDFNHIGFWLYPVFGAAVVTGSSDPYTHVFSSGLEVLPWRTYERKLASSFFPQDVGQVAATLDLQMSRAAGFQRATIGMIGQTQIKATSTGGGTPAAMWARDECNAALGVFKMNTGGGLAAAGQIMDFSLKYDNKGAAQDYVGSPLISGVDLDAEATCGGTIRVRVNDSTYYDLANAGVFASPNSLPTAFVGQASWTKSANRSLVIDLAQMRLEPVGIPIGSPGKLEQTFNWRAEQTASAAMLVATLKSLVASYTL